LAVYKLAALKGHLSTVELLLKTNAIDVDVVGSSGSTPLGAAASENQIAVMKFLLQKGASVNGKVRLYFNARRIKRA